LKKNHSKTRLFISS